MYLIFEGVDTSGKSTQATLLKEAYPDALLTKEPGGTALGLQLREMILHEGVANHKTELFLFLADRAEHYHEVIAPNRDKLIISDRGFISGIAYALANHPEYDLDFLLQLNRFALDNTLPDLVILLQTNEQLIRERMGTKSEDMIEKRGIGYLLSVQQNMVDILKKLNIKYAIYDASEPIERIHQNIKGLLA
ncbi:MAG: dTMP kinase [Sulfurospirillum sp.]|nr:MAG: dTMP kinase [Sulfurospirillum sp.]